MAVGDVDGDGRDEIVLGFGTGGDGWIEVRDDAAHGYAHLAWVRIQWPEYNASNGEVWPAVGDLDGDGKAEIVAGLGEGSGGYMEIFDDAATGFDHVRWVRDGWDRAYWGEDVTDGATHPAVGDVDGDGKADIVLGFGEGSSGWMEVRSGWMVPDENAVPNFAHLHWFQLGWQSYEDPVGVTWPAVGNLDADGREEIVVGLDNGGNGWIRILDDPATLFTHIQWVRVPWDEYDLAVGATHPTVGNTDDDAGEEIVVGFGAYTTYISAGSWLAAFDDYASQFAFRAWLRADEERQTGAETWPAIGTLRGAPPSPPLITPNGGTFFDPVPVTMSAPSWPDTVIRYTLDGSEPTESSTLYSAALLLDASATLRARAFRSGFSSLVASSTFMMTVASPTVSPASGTYANAQTVTLSTTTTGATIRFTTDGSTPTESSPAYSGSFAIDAAITIRAKGFKAGWTASTETATNYVFQASAPVFSPQAGTYPDNPPIYVTSSTPGGITVYAR